MDKTGDKASKIATSHFWDGYNCAESVLMAMQEAWEMEKRPDIATAFGAGIGRRGSVCGAVTGGIITINLKYGRMKVEEDKEKSYALALDYYKEFEKEFSSAICYDLIKCDLTTSRGQETFKESNFLRKNASGS